MSTLPEPATPSFVSSRNQSESQPSHAVITPITPPAAKTTAWYLARRIHVVLQDLGLLDHIPSGWLQPGPDGLSFRPLSVREADKLTLALEDLVHGYRPPRPSVDPDQLSLF